MDKLTRIITEMSDFVAATHKVEVDVVYSTVEISDLETGDTVAFLQDWEAERFLDNAKDLYHNSGLVYFDQAVNATAKPFVESVA